MKRRSRLKSKAPDCPECARRGRTICIHTKRAAEKSREPRKPLPPVNPERKRRLYERNYGDHADVVRRLPCVGCRPGLWENGAVPRPGTIEVSDPAHATSRGAGGDKTDLFPACRKHHRMYDERPWEWRRRFPRLDPHEIAARVWTKYGEEGAV